MAKHTKLSVIQVKKVKVNGKKVPVHFDMSKLEKIANAKMEKTSLKKEGFMVGEMKIPVLMKMPRKQDKGPQFYVKSTNSVMALSAQPKPSTSGLQKKQTTVSKAVSKVVSKTPALSVQAKKMVILRRSKRIGLKSASSKVSVTQKAGSSKPSSKSSASSIPPSQAYRQNSRYSLRSIPQRLVV